ncbi:MAG: MFS transporter [Rhizobiaceae bacterium]
MTSGDPLSGNAARSAFFRVFPYIILPMFLAQIDQTIVATALPMIAGELGQVDRVSWVVICYLIAVTVAAPVYGRLGDLVGRRKLMFVGLAVLIAGSLVCWLATSMEMLMAGRTIQGLGGGGLLTLSQALVGEAVPPRERARVQSYTASLAITSNSLGPILGGLLSDHFGWRSIFLFNMPVALIALVLAMRLAARPGTAKSFRFDVQGLFFFVLFVVSLLVLLRQVQQLDFGALPLLLGLLATAAVSATLLLRQERRSPVPLLPPQLFANGSIWRCYVIFALHGGIVVSLVTFLPIYYRIVHFVSASQTGLLLVPMMVSIGTGAIVAGRLIARTGNTATPLRAGLVAFTLSMAALALWSPGLSPVQTAFVIGGATLFLGSVVTVMQVIIQVAAGDALIGTAVGGLQQSRALGASLGTALVGAVLFMSVNAAGPDTGAMMAALLQKGPEALAGIGAQRQALMHDQIEDAFRLGFLAMALMAAVATVTAWTLPLRRI